MSAKVLSLDLARAARLPWRACEPYPGCDGQDMGWHIRTDDDDFDYIVCECPGESIARLIVEYHNQQRPND